LTGPLQIILALILLYRQMQLAVIPGVVLLLLLIPLNLFIQKLQKKIVVCRLIRRLKILIEGINFRQNKWD
jgi:regulator of protease activity HflC (stomatin/prohibitin superfamily)